MKKINSILKEVLERIEPKKEELDLIDDSLKNFLRKIGEKIKKYKVDVEIFIGGSFAKNTVIKKDNYDIDIFLRFNKKYSDKEISELTRKFIGGIENVLVVHGSRDYFRIKFSEFLFIELIPVIKVKSPKESENITDLSYSHVKYINKKAKSKKILQEIKLTKAFCYANHCYGAESYIQGFSGYALELLVYHYGSFLKFIKAMIKIKGEAIKDKEIIDIEKHFKNKKNVLLDLNGSKLQSPIILIDPTYKQRNALAALSYETFEKFQDRCKEFLKNPDIKYFELEKTDLEKIKKDAENKKLEFILIETKTDKQAGDVAGSKLLKFYKYLEKEISRFFEVKNKGFNYNGKKSARCFFVVKKKKEILFKGPGMKDVKNMKAFEKVHKDYFTKKGRVYAREKVEFSINEFLAKWKLKNKKIIKEMYVTGLKKID
jgi:tRNA nucleotidyltransferase (CCA-adding enzyme)